MLLKRVFSHPSSKKVSTARKKGPPKESTYSGLLTAAFIQRWLLSGINRIHSDRTETKPVATLGVLLVTQAGQYELSRVSAHNPEQAKNTDAIEGGVPSTLTGRGGVKHTLAGCL